MNKKDLHIVCLNAPSPPNYGGAIDMHYKIAALSEAGYKIRLHYFNYYSGRNTEGLEKYNVDVYCYKRKTGLTGFSWRLPYIVSSRLNQQLLDCLNRDNSPILLEGIHTTGILPLLKNPSRAIIRMHNDESVYYRQLAQNEKNRFKRLYYSIEYAQLKKYQKQLPAKYAYACLSENDKTVLEEIYGFTNVHFIPAFIPWQTIDSKEGKGNYCLYHGNLSVSENKKAALWLAETVFSQISIPFVIAGKGIDKELKKKVGRLNQVFLVADPPEDEMKTLIRDAHIHVLPSFNKTGVKLKLLNALFNGRFCITNAEGIKGSGIEKGVLITNNSKELVDKIQQVYLKNFTENDIQERSYLTSLYSNAANAQKLSALW